MSLDYFYSGKLDSSSAYNSCKDELAEIEEIFREDKLSLNALEGSGLQQDDLENAWRLIMRKINIDLKIPDRIARKSEIIDFVESVVQKKIKAFPVNMLRFSMPKYERSRVAWHQDSQTWPGIEKTYSRLKNSQVVTFWTCLTKTDDKNGLSFALDMPLTRFQHKFSEGQGYFNANLGVNNIASVETVFGDPYTGVIFGQDRLHRSAVGSLRARVSIDLRFYCEN